MNLLKLSRNLQRHRIFPYMTLQLYACLLTRNQSTDPHYWVMSCISGDLFSSLEILRALVLKLLLILIMFSFNINCIILKLLSSLILEASKMKIIIILLKIYKILIWVIILNNNSLIKLQLKDFYPNNSFFVPQVLRSIINKILIVNFLLNNNNICNNKQWWTAAGVMMQVMAMKASAPNIARSI